MTGCLPDRVLWDLSEGDGAAADHEHLTACRLCQWRSRRLVHDVKVIGAVLHSVPPLAPVAVAEPPSRTRWVAAAALAAISLALTLTIPRPPEAPPARVVGTDMPMLDAVSRAVFPDAGIVNALGSAAPSELDLMAAAVDDAVPCEWQPGGCEEVQ